MKRARIAFAAPKVPGDLAVVERVRGGPGTDFGVPGAEPKADAGAATSADLRRMARILDACRAEFDATAKAASGRRLRAGPRGGGRDLDRMVLHVLEAEEAYAAAVGIRPAAPGARSGERMATARRALDAALVARERGELPDKGPRGGDRWRARYAVRRSAWHWLDHAWEIEDRVSA